MSARRYFVKPDHVQPYSPANHTGTVNRRLIGPETVGAEQLEVVLGVVEKARGHSRIRIPVSSRSATCWKVGRAPKWGEKRWSWSLAIAASFPPTCRTCSR
jgi:hypothetical protein